MACRLPISLPAIAVDGVDGGERMERRKFAVTIIGATVMLATAGAAPAQGRGPQGVPPGQRPPAGLCRVWYDNVPPGRQPAPTSCRDAERRAGQNARVIYGDARGEVRGERRQDDRQNDRRRGADRDGRNDHRRGGGWQARLDGSQNDRRRSERDDRDDDRRSGGWQLRRDGVPEKGRGEPGRSRVGSDGRNRTGNSGASSCAYLDPSGRCVSTGRRDMPMMSRTYTLERDQRREVERYWLGDGAVTAQYRDRDRNGVPEEILWYDRRRALVQRWQDSDLNGRADEIVIYRDGVARVIR